MYSSVPSSLESQTRKLVSDVIATECCPETAKRLSETGAEVVSDLVDRIEQLFTHCAPPGCYLAYLPCSWSWQTSGLPQKGTETQHWQTVYNKPTPSPTGQQGKRCARVPQHWPHSRPTHVPGLWPPRAAVSRAWCEGLVDCPVSWGRYLHTGWSSSSGTHRSTLYTVLCSSLGSFRGNSKIHVTASCINLW